MPPSYPSFYLPSPFHLLFLSPLSLSVNSVSTQTDKTVQFTRPNIQGSTRKSPLKTPPPPSAPTHPRSHIHTIYILTARYLWHGPHPPLTLLQATIFTITLPSIILMTRADCFHMGSENSYSHVHIRGYTSSRTGLGLFFRHD